MRRFNFLILLFVFGIVLLSCQSKIKSTIDDNGVLETITYQMTQQVDLIAKSKDFKNPRTIENGKIKYVQYEDWTSGFFPGSMWYMYDLTGDDKWKDRGIQYVEAIEEAKYLTSHHDIGFIINCSFGNAYTYTKNQKYKEIIHQAANSLITRYYQNPGVLKSWEENKDWQKTRNWMCPVIIDNMMNLELLFKATQFTGDSIYYKIAVNHADNTLANHFRLDNSSYHVIDYDTITGNVRSKETAQGYAHESSWSRGQAWALYGYTMMYRRTKDEKYLDQAIKIYEFVFNHPNLPEDLVPYWDLNDPNIPNAPRDASSACIMASALYELSTYAEKKYKNTADKLMTSLSSNAYLAEKGSNHNFILMHSVGSLPHNNEIDVPLNYADYYFLEALIRKRNLENHYSIYSVLL